MHQKTGLDKRIMLTEVLLPELEIVQPNSLQKTLFRILVADRGHLDSAESLKEYIAYFNVEIL